MIITLIHSFQFITNPYMYNSYNQSIINTNTNTKIIGLLHVPTDPLYSLKLIPINPCIYNLKIIIEFDYSKLYNLVSNKEPIPNKEELLILLKNTYCTDINKIGIDTSRIKKISNTNVNRKPLQLYKKNIIKLNQIIINTETGEFSLSKSIHPTDYTYSFKKKNSILYSYYTKHTLNKLIKPSTLNLIIYTIKDTYNLDKDSVLFIKNEEDLLIVHNYKYCFIHKTVYENLGLESTIYTIYWNTIILVNIHTIKTMYMDLKANTKYILFNTLESHIYTMDHLKLLSFITNDTICLKNKYNINLLSSFFYYLQHKKLSIKKKTFRLTGSDKTYIKKLTPTSKYIYKSLPENYSNYNYIYKDSLKQNKIYKQLFDESNSYLNPTCCICYNTIKQHSLTITKCNHYYCHSCIIHSLANVNSNCPQCRTSIPHHSLLKLNISNKSSISSKLKYILNMCRTHICLIVSHYTKSVIRLKELLSHRNIQATYIDKLNKSTELNGIYLADIKTIFNIKCIHKFSKIIYLEDSDPHFEYYYYYMYDKINTQYKKTIQVLKSI